MTKKDSGKYIHVILKANGCLECDEEEKHD